MESGEIDNGIITQGRGGQQPNSKPIIEVVDNTVVEPLTIISTVTSTTEATRIVTRRISVTTTTTKSTSSSTNNRLGAYVTSEKEEKEEEEREVEGYEVDEEDASVTDMSITPPPMTRVHNGDTSSQHHNTTTIPAESERKRICLVGTTVDDNDTISAAKSFGVPIVTSETAMEFVMDDEWMTYYVMNAFDGPMFEAIRQNKRNRILGPPALKSAAKSLEGLPNRSKPTYNYAMKGVATCFTGIRDKDVLTRLVNLIHAMGGSIKKDMNPNVTHLICNKSEGEKYQYAMIFGLVVVREEWVYSAWENRDVPEFSALDKEFTKVRALRPFEGLRICFFGFSAEEYQHMVDILDSNGGTATSLDDPKCSHVIVDEHTVQSKPEPYNSKTHIVKSDWFWYTIQNGFAYVADYSFGDYLEQIANTPSCDRRDSLPINFNKRKRKRLSRKEVKEECFTPTGTGKRRSSVSNAGLLSMSGSFLDCTTSPDKHSHLHSGDVSKKGIPELDLLSEGANQQGSTGPVQSSGTPSQPTKSRSMRYNHFMEFFHTESNYVGILNTILYLFKEPLENMSENVDEALLNKSEIKAIFGNFLSIHEVHKKMLDKLKEIHSSWSEDCLIGKIILDNRKDLVKAYPPYVNFFEQMKEALIQCDTQKPRFHAFLKINQAKPECGRQSLQDLMIRPVQRLPSISLLLNDTLKHTPKNNPDAKHLEEALRAIKEVMTYINEDKRKTDGQLAMFDIFNNIENCPPHLVSSHRCFVSRCEVTELSDQLSGRGDALMLFLFNDNMEVCKKRSRAFNSLKSPNNGPSHVDLGPGSTGSGVGGNQTKPYKHIKLMPLSSIRLVVDITDNPRAFALNCRLNKENKDKLYYFSIAEDMETDKILYLRNLCKQLAENACRTDAEKFLVSVESQELDIDLSDLNVGTLSKAFKFATRTRLKVGRAFSFNKTPSKLKRAVSTMMTSPFGSTNSLTPATQLAQMKLASCTNIDEIGEEGSDEKEVLVAPMSVQPTRKASKNGSLSVAALRRI